MKLITIFLLIPFFLFAGFTKTALSITANEIVNRANVVSYYEGNDGKARIKMAVKTRGSERNKEFVVLRLNKEKGGEQKFYVYYEKPDDIRGTVYMVWKHIEADDDRWLYLPGLNLVTRVAASDKRSRFAGSDFVYEDISGRNVRADNHELTGETETRYMLKSVPKEPGSVEFSYFTAEIDKSNFMPMKIEYFDNNGKLMRTVETMKVENIGGHPTTTEAVAKDHRSGGETRINFTDIEYDVGLSDDIFTERYLQRPPRKWMK